MASTKLSLQQQSAEWNAANPVGTLVRYWRGAKEGEPTGQGHTKHEATVLGDCAAVVWIEGCSGCIALSHVEVVVWDIRDVERSFAYEFAAGVIESSCTREQVEGDDYEYFDLDSAESCGEPLDLGEEERYLDSRRLLVRHATNPRWVSICDEDEPLTAAEQAGA